MSRERIKQPLSIPWGNLMSSNTFLSMTLGPKEPDRSKRLLHLLLTGINSIHFYRSWRFSVSSVPFMADISALLQIKRWLRFAHLSGSRYHSPSVVRSSTVLPVIRDFIIYGLCSLFIHIFTFLFYFGHLLSSHKADKTSRKKKKKSLITDTQRLAICGAHSFKGLSTKGNPYMGKLKLNGDEWN